YTDVVPHSTRPPRPPPLPTRRSSDLEHRDDIRQHVSFKHARQGLIVDERGRPRAGPPGVATAVGDDVEAEFAVGRFDRPVGFAEDRKSTRLNSSHVQNSYAVFC